MNDCCCAVELSDNFYLPVMAVGSNNYSYNWVDT